MSRRLASSFVVTVAVSAIAGCGSGRTQNPPPPPDIHRNPPRPTEEPVGSVEVETDPPVTPEPVAPEPTNEVIGPPTNPPAPQPDLPEAAPNQKPWKNSLGHCYVERDFECPKGNDGGPSPTCNPPPPKRVKCPERM